MRRLSDFLVPPENGERSKFDRHYGTRTAKRWRDGCLILLGFSMLALVVIALDPLFSHQRIGTGPLLITSLLCTIFLALGISFHLRYRSRE